ncbi:MAG: ubiquitin family protein [Anaerolineae bacterium]
MESEPGAKMLQVEIDLLGIARRAVGQKHILLNLAEQSSYQDLVRLLAEQYPSLVGQVINPQTMKLFPSFMLNLGGRQVIKDYSQRLSGGENLILMFVESGG